MASLGEILSARGDADNAGGGGVVLPSSAQAAQFIADAAKGEAAFNNFLAAKHEKQVSDAVNEVNSLDYSDVVPDDLPEITKRYAEVMGDINNHFDAITDPASNVKKYSEIMARRAQLRSMISTSKAQNAVYKQNQKTIDLHPDFNTEENQALMSNFTKTPIDQRRQFMLKTPISFNPGPLAKASEASVKKVSKKEALSKGGDYFITTEGEYIPQDEYLKSAIANAKGTYVNGRTLWQDFESMYEKVPANSDGTKPPIEDVFNELMLRNKSQDKVAVTMKPNEVAMSNKRMAQSERESLRANALGWARLTQEGKALKANEIKPEDAADAKNLALYELSKTGGQLDATYGQNIYGSNISDESQVIHHTTGGKTIVDPVTGLPVTPPLIQTTIPRRQYISAVGDGKGGAYITIQENSEGPNDGITKKIVRKHETYDQLNSSFNKIYGNKFATQLAAGTSAFNRKIFKVARPQITDLRNRYEPDAPVPAQPKPTTTTPKAKDPLGIL